MTPAQVKATIEKMLTRQVEVRGVAASTRANGGPGAALIEGHAMGLAEAARILTEALAASGAENAASTRETFVCAGCGHKAHDDARCGMLALGCDCDDRAAGRP